MKRMISMLFLSAVVITALMMTFFSKESKAIGNLPDPFNFQGSCAQYPDVMVESNSVTITGISEPVSISIMNGEYSINGAPYTSETGMVEFGQTVSVRHKTAAAADAMNSSILTVGGFTTYFTSSTGPCLRGTQ